jgi:uncharacterized protein YdeI (YjbR/CyaY-like superfamily)
MRVDSRLTMSRMPEPPLCPELARALRQARGLRRFFDSFNESIRSYEIDYVCQAKKESTRRRRAEQVAEWFMATMAAEEDLPPLIATALARNAKAREAWDRLEPSRRREYLFFIFRGVYPETRANTLARMIGYLDGSGFERERRAWAD